MNRRPGHALRKRLQCILQIAALRLAQSADDVAHLGEEGAGQALGLHHMIVRPAGLGHVACDFELQPKRGQLMPPGVVQVARDAQALGVAHGVGDDGLCGPELPVGLGAARAVSPSLRSACAVKRNNSCNAADLVRTQHKSGFRACASVPMITRFCMATQLSALAGVVDIPTCHAMMTRNDDIPAHGTIAVIATTAPSWMQSKVLRAGSFAASGPSLQGLPLP